MMMLVSIIRVHILVIAFGWSVRATFDVRDTGNVFGLPHDGHDHHGVGKAATNDVRIVGGTPIDKTRYPYFTALFYSSLDDGIFPYTFLCGGSLIREDVVLTAGHCILYNNDRYVRQVFVNFTSYDDLRYGYARTVSRVFRHPEFYDEGNPVNDIALLFLDSPVSGVTTLALNGNASIPNDDDVLTAIGAGYTQENSATASSVVMAVDVPKVNDEKCIEQLPDYFVEPSVMLCAGYDSGGKDTCQGDSGGPYIILGASPEDDMLVGLTSFGDGCARPNSPAVTTRVSAFQDWILCALDGECTQSPTGSPTTTPTPPPPIYLEGPIATVNITLTTDAYPNITEIYFQDWCKVNGQKTYVVQAFTEDILMEYTTYYYTFTLPVGEYAITTHDDHDYTDLKFLGSIVYSSDNVILHELSPYDVFFYDVFRIVVGDGGTCSIPAPVPITESPSPMISPGPSQNPLTSEKPSLRPSPQTPSNPPSIITHATCDDTQDVTFPVLLNGTLTQKTCDWLAGKRRRVYRNMLCKIGNLAYDTCAETCKKCYDTCVDEKGDFPSLYFRSKMVNCADLAKHGERWRGKYCDEGQSPLAEMLCKETCNTCD